MTILKYIIIASFGLAGFVWLVLPFIGLRNFSPFQPTPMPPLPKPSGDKIDEEKK